MTCASWRGRKIVMKPIRRAVLKSKKLVLSTTFVIAAFGLAMVSLPVFAAEHQNACKDDIQKFCSSVDPKDHKAIHACLKTHKDEVSDPCKQQMAHKRGKKSSSTSAPAAGGTPAPAPATAQ